MAPVSPIPANQFSPKPPVTAELSVIEEGKVTPSQPPTPDITVSPINAHKIIAELVGTYIIIFIGCGSVIINSNSHEIHQLSMVGIAVAWGLSVMVMIYSLGHVSGGHFNPAVTIAFAVSYKFPWREVPGYVGSQLAGSILGILSLNVMLKGEKVDIKVTTTQFVGEVTAIEAFLWEFIISFIVMLTICGVATDNRAINELSGVAVGAAVIINMIVAGSMTGASMNPARSFGAALVSKHFGCVWVYVSAPIFGMIAASTIYSFLWLPPSENSDIKNV